MVGAAPKNAMFPSGEKTHDAALAAKGQASFLYSTRRESGRRPSSTHGYQYRQISDVIRTSLLVLIIRKGDYGR